MMKFISWTILSVPCPVMLSSFQTLSALSLEMYQGRFLVDGSVGRSGLVMKVAFCLEREGLGLSP